MLRLFACYNNQLNLLSKLKIVSVIIPMFNAERSIIQTLDSVREQTYTGLFEILVINDGSTDNSVALVESYKQQFERMDIQLIHQSNQGVSIARNNGLVIAKGTYIALLDADDEWLVDKTKNQIKVIESNETEVDLLGTLRNGKPLLLPYKLNNKNLAEVTLKKLLIRNELQPSTVLFKRKVLENTGYFNPKQSHAEDVDYWMRATLHNKLYILGEDLLLADGGKRSFGSSGLSANLKAMSKGYLNNIKRLRQAKRISLGALYFYSLLYRFKYIVLLTRTSYYSAIDKK